MCDKLLSSKDGIIDLSHSRIVECSSHGSHYSSISGSNTSKSRKQKKHHKGDYQSCHDSDRDWESSDKRQPVKGRRSTSGGDGRRWNRMDREKHGGTHGEHWMNEVVTGGDYSPRASGKKKESGKKKVAAVSLNHLLNFTVASSSRRDSGNAMDRPCTRHRRRNASHSYNKEEFLQANCQFVVSASGEYSVHASNPDKLVEWQQIEQVRLFCHEIPSCPICLYPPKAAKITRCGHVYCWSCLLHYLCLSDKKWSKCPICNESIYRQDIKSVVALSSPRYKVGDTVTMKLMVREKGTTQVFPKMAWSDQKDKILNIEDTCVNRFVKLLTATPSQVLSLIVGPERRELEAQMTGLEKDDDSESCFIQGALDDLKVREDHLTRTKVIGDEVEQMVSEVPTLRPSFPAQRSISSPATSSAFNGGMPPRGLSKVSWKVYSDQYLEADYQAAFSEDEDACSNESSGGEEEEDCGDQAVEAEEKRYESLSRDQNPDSISTSDSHSSPQSVSDDSSGRDTASPVQGTLDNLVYFYQASDGQHLYVHPINTKCLAKEYGSLSNSPPEITATLVELEQLTMSEDVRGRFRCFKHLPLTCQFALCELELKPPVVSHGTLKHFMEEIQKRKQKRLKKKKDEKKREKKAEAAKDKSYQGSSASDLTPEKFHDFLSLATSPSLLESATLSMGKSVGESSSSASASPSVTPEKDAGSSPSTPSFAQALQGKTAPVWPVKSALSRNQDGSKLQCTPVKPSKDGVEENAVVPSFQDAFNEAFETAAQKGPEGRPGSRMAKKGRKKLVLFSTGGSRGAC